MILDPFALDVLDCIRRNGYEVSLITRGSIVLVTIFDLERDAETSVALNEENRLAFLDRLASDYCTLQQQEALFMHIGAGLARVA